MTTAWSRGRRGQALAVGIGVLGLLLVWIGIIHPLASWFAARDLRLAQQRELLAHSRDLAMTLPLLQATAEQEHQKVVTGTAALLAGASDAIAAASLQQTVRRVATHVSVALVTVETLPTATATGHWQRIALRISFTAPWAVLIRLLQSIEQLPTLIIVDEVHFRALATTPAMPVQASMVLYGLWSIETANKTMEMISRDDNRGTSRLARPSEPAAAVF